MFRSVLKNCVKKAELTVSSNIASKGFATYKTSTGLTGLKVDPNGRENLIILSDEILKNVKKIPETSQYRIDVEKWFVYIKRICTENADVKVIEDEICLGQIEEVIEQAKAEKTLVEFYFEHKVWEMVAQAQLEADEAMAELADNIFFNDPKNRSAV